MLGHIVEDHLPRYRSDELQAGEKPVVGKLILTRNTVSTMGLDGPVEAENSVPNTTVGNNFQQSNPHTQDANPSTSSLLFVATEETGH